MRKVFADTGYWIALLAPDDALHKRALAVTEALGRCSVLTSQMVLTEFLNQFSRYGERHRVGAAQFVCGLATEGNVTVVPQTPELFVAALDLYLERSDKAWSLTDCASILICQRQGITDVLAHDRHFSQAGFVPLLRGR